MLVLGAGCSREAINTQRQKLPLGDALAGVLCDEFGLERESETLPEVIEALESENPRQLIDEKIVASLRVFQPSEDHIRQAKLFLRRVYTLNIDNALEIALTRVKRENVVLQRNDPPVEPSLMYNETQVVKLNGCVSRPNDGFIFSLSDYSKNHHKMPNWYTQLASDCFSQTVVFIGTEANEPLLFDAINRVSQLGEKLKAYLVVPNLSDLRQKLLRQRGLTWVPGTYSDLLDALEADGCFELSSLDLAERKEPSIRELRNTPEADRSQLLSLLGNLIPVKPNKASDFKTGGRIRAFYEGYRATESDFDDQVPADLHHVSRVKSAIEEAIASEKKLVAITGPIGTGKNTALHMAARQLATDKYDAGLFFLARNADRPYETVRKVAKIYQKPIILFVESLFEARDTVRLLIADNPILDVLVVACEPSNTWKNSIAGDYSEDEVSVIELSEITEEDANRILEKLEKFGPWTILSKKSKEKRLESLLRKSQKQLLIGLLEATQGRGYAEIIRQDFSRTEGEQAKFLLAIACLCTMFGKGVPLDVAIRAFSYRFEDGRFHSALAKLEGTGRQHGQFIEARHPVYASAIFENMLSVEQKADAILYTLQAFSDYGSPIPINISRDKSRIFKGIFNYRFLFRIFENSKTEILDIFRHFETVFHTDGAYWLQYGLTLRKFGDHEESLTMIQRSVAAYKSNFSQHALGLQFFILADKETRPSVRRDYVERAVEVLRNIKADVRYDDSYPIITLAKGHVKYHLRDGDIRKAVEIAQQYVDEVDLLAQQKPRDNFVSDLRRNLWTLISAGIVDESYWYLPTDY